MGRERIAVLVNGTRDSAGGIRARQLLDNADCTVLHLYRHRGRARGLITFLVRGLAFRPTIVYVMDIAAAGVLAALAIRVVRRARVVVDTGDATTALARSTGRAGSLSLAAIALVERLAHRRSQLVVVRGRYHQLHLRDRGLATPIIQVPDLPPPADRAPGHLATEPAPTGSRSATLRLGLVGSLAWCPRLQRCYGWDLIEAIASLGDLEVDAVVIGDGDGLEWLKQRARDLGVAHRVSFLGAVPSSQLGPHLQGIDICLSTQTDDLPGWVRTTGKLPLYLASGRFVIATDVGEASWVLPPEMLLPYSGVTDPTYPKRLAARIRSLHGSTEIEQLASTGPQLVKRYFDPETHSRRLLAELRVAGPRAA